MSQGLGISTGTKQCLPAGFRRTFFFATLALSLSVATGQAAPNRTSSTSAPLEPAASSRPAEFQSRKAAQPQTFQLWVLEIPVEDLHLVDNGLGDPELRNQLLIERGGRKLIRFPVHPDNEALYRPLIDKYGVSGQWFASPAGLERTVVARASPGSAVFSLVAKLGVVADWEIRRSVLVSQLAATTPQEIWAQNGVSLVPDILGAYVDRAVGLGHFVDESQFRIFQHGVVFRDPAVFDEYRQRHPDHEIVPLSLLFSRRDQAAPLIVEWWKEKGGSFYEFVDQAVLGPLARALGYLVFEQGLVPGATGFDPLVAVNRGSHQIEHLFFGDAGSLKVDLRLRLSKGLPVAALRSRNAVYDFGLAQATSAIAKALHAWSVDGYTRSLAPYVSRYEAGRLQRRFDRRLVNEVNARLPLHRQLSRLSARELAGHVERYLRAQAPASAYTASPMDAETAAFIEAQRGLRQVIRLPSAWKQSFGIGPGQAARTEFGIIFSDGESLAVAFEGNGSGEHPLHYVVEAPIERIYAGQLLIGDEVTRRTLEQRYLEGRLQHKIVPVIRAGTREDPFYQVLDSHNSARFLIDRENRKTLKVRVVADLVGLGEAEQLALLEQAGFFWSPQNPTAKYQRLRMTELTPSAWRDLLEVVQGLRMALPFEVPLEYPELALARIVYEKLRSRYGAELVSPSIEWLLEQMQSELIGGNYCEGHLIPVRD